MLSEIPLRDLVGLVLLLVLVGTAMAHRALLRRAIRRLEQDADTQYEVHRVATWYWVVNFPIVALMFFGFPDLWVRLGLLLNTFYSLYANLATDYGAMSAALAARRQPDSSSETLEIVRSLRTHQQSTCRHCREKAAA